MPIEHSVEEKVRDVLTALERLESRYGNLLTAVRRVERNMRNIERVLVDEQPESNENRDVQQLLKGTVNGD